MEVFGHDCESMQQVTGLVAAMEKGLEEQVCVCGSKEQGFPLRGVGSDGAGVEDVWLGEAYRRG